MPGVSMRYSFDDGEAADRHITQYNETIGNRSIYHDGWLAAVVHFVAWEKPNSSARPTMPRTSGSCTTRAKTSASPTIWPTKYPEKLEFLKALFNAEALKNNVFPLDDRAGTVEP